MYLTKFPRTLATVVGVSLAVFAAVGVALAQGGTADMVTIKTFMYSPMAMTVEAATTVTWKKLDGEPYTVVNDAGLFRSAALDQNDTFTFRFAKPGVYKVFCGIHPNMRETITVH